MVSYYAANGIHNQFPLDSYYCGRLKDFMPSTFRLIYDGKLYAIAPTESSVALFYNKDYLDKAGIIS